MIARFLIAAPIALIVSAAFIGAAVPAFAAPVTTCATTPGQLRAFASTASIDAQKEAMMLISTGERLCALDARAEAGKKFVAAARTLKLDLAALPTATASAQ